MPTELYPEFHLLPEVIARTRLSAPTIWRLERKGKFPKRLVIGFRRVAWRVAELDRWMADPASFKQLETKQ
jgi:prophage regulatory protein